MYDCPRDFHTLMQHPAETGTTWRCNVCSGAFLSELLAREVASRNLALGPREGWDLEVQCPRDASPMQKVRVGSVAIDYCMACSSAWLDGEEVERLFSTPEAEQVRTQANSQAGLLSSVDWVTPTVNSIVDALLRADW